MVRYNIFCYYNDEADLIASSHFDKNAASAAMVHLELLAVWSFIDANLLTLKLVNGLTKIEKLDRKVIFEFIWERVSSCYQHHQTNTFQNSKQLLLKCHSFKIKME